MTESFPTESRFSDAHTFSWGGKEYDTYKLIQYGESIKPIKMEVSELEHELDVLGWTDMNGKMFTARELLQSFNELGSLDKVGEAHPEWAGHIWKMKRADYSYPILIYQYELIDGTHRLLKAFIDGVPDIPVKIIDVLLDDAQYNS